MSFVIQKIKEIREKSKARIEAFIKEVKEKGVIGATVSAIGKLFGRGPKIASQVVSKWKFPLLRVTAFVTLKTMAGIGKILFGKIPAVEALEKKASEIIAPLKEMKIPGVTKPPIIIPTKKVTASIATPTVAKTPTVTYKLYGGTS